MISSKTFNTLHSKANEGLTSTWVGGIISGEKGGSKNGRMVRFGMLL